MAKSKFKFWGISDANAAIRAADAAINPLLEKAQITTIEVNGQAAPATSDEVPLDAKIAAFAATVKSGAADAQVSQLLANNEILAAQAKSFETRAVTAETSNATLVGENEALKARIGVLEKNVQTLTAENAQVVNLRSAANAEAGRVTEQLNGINSELSRVCLKYGVLTDLKDKDGALLPSTASQTDKEAAANAAIAKVGIEPGKIPSTNGTATNLPDKQELTGRERFINAVQAAKAAKK